MISWCNLNYYNFINLKLNINLYSYIFEINSELIITCNYIKYMKGILNHIEYLNRILVKLNSFIYL